MNCVPGDLCVVRSPRYGGFCNWTGLLVEVIEPVVERHYLPDVGMHGRFNNAAKTEWFCRIIGNEKRPNFCGNGIMVMSSYGRMWDHRLKPLRDQPGADETLIYAGLPQPIEIDCTTKQGAEHE